MRKQYIVLYALLLFCFTENVNATTVNYKNVCKNNDTTTFNTSNCNTLTVTSTSTSKTEIEEIETPKSDSSSYDILLLIDNSGSMLDDGYDGQNRKTAVINTINQIRTKISDYDTSNETKSTIKYIFSEIVKDSPTSEAVTLYDKTAGKNTNFTNEMYKLDGNTNLQGLWKSAYKYYLNIKKINNETIDYTKNNSAVCTSKSRVPMVIMITDGYPNYYTPNFKVGIDSKIESTQMFSPIYTYYTIMTMINLQQNICNLKIMNFGIGMSKNDYLTQFMLNPKEYYSKINTTSSDNISSASKILYNIIQQNNNVYDIKGFLRTSNDGSPEYGMFGGTLKNDSNSKIVEYDTNFTPEFLKQWKKNGRFLELSYPSNDDEYQNVQYYSNGKWNDISRSYIRGKGCKSTWGGAGVGGTYKNIAWGYCYVDIKSNFVSDATKNITKIRINFKKNKTFNKTPISNPISVSTINNISNISAYVGGDGSEITKFLNDNLLDNPTGTKEPVNVTTVTHTSCKEYNNLSIGTFYIKTDSDVYAKDSNNNYRNIGRCGPVSVSVSAIMTENIQIDIAKPSGPIYAGGGFSWYNNSYGGNGASSAISDSTKWYYKYLNNSDGTKTPLFQVKYNFVKRKTAGSGYDKVEDEAGTYWSLKDLQLYSDSNCSRSISANKLDETVWSNNLKNKILTINKYAFNNKFYSIDNNDATISNVSISVNKNDWGSDNINNKKVYNADTNSSNTFTTKYKASISTAYINRQTSNVSYNSGFANDKNYINGGTLYYIPLKYAKDNVSINVNGQFSVIDGKKINLTTSCSVKVKKILYECPTGENCNPSELKIAYKYRSIDTNNPFPKNIVPSNWQTFMQNTANVNRLKNSYNALNYSYTFKNDNLDKINNGNSYTSWSGISENGTSGFVKQYFNTNKPVSGVNYCPLGVFKESCNKR